MGTRGRASPLLGHLKQGGTVGKLKEKKICKRVKDEVEDLKEYRRLVKSPTHLCTKCGRVSNDKKLLCRPEKLD